MFKKILHIILKPLAKAVINKYKPTIIAITGSVGKTSTKEAIFCLLSKYYKTRHNARSYNNEIGVPLSILGFESPGKNVFLWFFIFLKTTWMILLKQKGYPEILVLEFGADRPRDIGYLTSFVKPDIGVVTAVGEIPVHVEFFAGPQEIAKEKSEIVKPISSSGHAILNYDDDVVFDMKQVTKARVIGFGFGEGALVRAKSLKIDKLSGKSFGTSCVIQYNDQSEKVFLPNIFGKQQIYSILAACGVGIAMGISLKDCIFGIKNFETPPGRMKLISGIKQSFIIDDSYNAAPASMHAALDVLGTLSAKRKIAVLGDMRELGRYSFEAHEAVGDRVAKVADILVAIGDKGKIIAEHAKERGLDSKQIFWFDLSALELEAASKKLQAIIKPGDLILVKGSQAMRLEKVIEEIMAQPENAKRLLVRQDKAWKARPI
ncbi:hypothetical protein C4553_03075 [Candidatus Parcubacteria bacterium]|nr:MAG: hypothetical protein C4553_03075 [Candidatus Parcubacteria bacterium]